VCLEWSIIRVDRILMNLPSHTIRQACPHHAVYVIPKHKEEATDDIREKGERG